ncbi:hypothetical protein [Patulibacter americanus]|uniref:hypothetical protein n=1 Tax=Patulibacter americanus TaxID=588672 RepID=UPI0003B56811|nr:hypothetical protein [Patulibacter americanus]
MSRPRRTVLFVLVPLLALGSAADASTPSVGPQKLFTGRTSPVSVPGTDADRGRPLRRGDRLVYREIVMRRGSKPRTTTLTVPTGTKLVGLAVSGGQNLQLAPGSERYIGRRSVRLVVRYDRTTRNGRIYALGRR